MNKSHLLGALLTGLLIFSSANAEVIVDTGPGISDGGNNWSLNVNQWLAAEFTIAADTTIDSIEGWMGKNTTNGFGTFAIYTDGGEIPGSELFSTPFLGNTNNFPAWVGVSDLGWGLAAGTYWVSYEVREGQALHTIMTGGSANPLLNEADYRLDPGEWRGVDDLDLGVRITGSPVPIPPAIWLFGSGLLGLVGMARKKTHAT